VDTSHEEIVEINHSFSYHLLIDRRMDYESSATSLLPRLIGISWGRIGLSPNAISKAGKHKPAKLASLLYRQTVALGHVRCEENLLIRVAFA